MNEEKCRYPDTLITIGRSFGSGGGSFAMKLHEVLDYPVYDKELLERAAEDSKIRKELFERVDERSTTPVIPYVFSAGFPVIGNVYTTMANNCLSSEHLFGIQSETIEKLAEKGYGIFVGRCSDYVLRNHPRRISIFVADTKEERIQRLMKQFSVDEDEAKGMMEKVDKNRQEYYNYYTSWQWGQADNYDLSFRLSTVGMDNAVSMVLDLIRKI